MHFGGTSSAWGGLCVPFDPIDFEERPWASAPAWPVAYAEVARWFYEAGNFLDCGLVFESTGSFLAAAESVDTRQIGRLTQGFAQPDVSRQHLVLEGDQIVPVLLGCRTRL